MSDKTFLAAINDEPHNDIPRLVYADWLDEHGNPSRAEFIRVQITFTQTSIDDPQYDELLERQRQLLHAHGEAWKNQTVRPRGVLWEKFSRGFINEAIIEGPHRKDFEPRPLADACRAAPITRLSIGLEGRLRIDGWNLANVSELEVHGSFLVDDLLALLTSPEAAAIKTLDLSPSVLADADLLRLIASPHLHKLRRLDLSSIPIGSTLAEALAAAPTLANLTALKLGWSGHFEGPRIEDAGLQALAASVHLKQLRELEIANSRITAAGVQAIAESRTFGALRRLCLYGDQVGPAGIQAVAESPYLSRLVDLDLGGCALTAAGVHSLTHSPSLAAVRWLSVGGNRAGDPLIPSLASAAYWQLTRLSLCGVNRSASEAATLASAPSLAGLISLDLQGNATLGTDGIGALFASPQWSNLRSLNLSSCSVDAKAAEAIAASSSLRRLHTLDLGFNEKLGDAGVIAISRWPGLASVGILDLAYCAIGNDGAKALLESPSLKPGVNLQLFGNGKIAKATINRLTKKYGAAVWWSSGDEDY